MIDKLYAKNLQFIDSLLEKLKTTQSLSYNEYKTILEKTYPLFSVNDDELYNKGLSVICHVADSSPKDTFINQLLYDCIIASRVFLYAEMYKSINSKYKVDIEEGRVLQSNFDIAAESFYTLDTETVLTRDQRRLFDDFQKYKRLIVSAPTSFGKSRIVSEIIIRNRYNNCAIILPTIALLSETYHTFKKNKYLTKYNIINSLTQPLGKGNNILIFTPERMDLFLDQNPLFELDFFTMDEIYKIQDDDRRQIFTHCLYRLSKMNCDFYLIGPYFQSFSQKFIERTGAKFRRYTAEIVQKDTHDLSIVENQQSYKLPMGIFKKVCDEDRNLVNLIKIMGGQSLVYVGRRMSVETRAKRIAERTKKEIYSSELIDYIKDTIDENWSLVKCLEKRVAFHHSGVPKYIQTEIVDAFNNSNIDVIVCSPTLTEGVNTSAKNVIIYDNFKAKEENKLSGFDVKNIKGRAGRFSIHFVGRVITFEKLDESEKDIIEFSYFDNNLNPEEAIQVDSDELQGSNLNIRKIAEQQLRSENIPLSIIKSNKFIAIHYQIRFINYLRQNIDILERLNFKKSYPEKEQLAEIIELCYEFLFSDRDKGGRSFAVWDIVNYAKYYIYKRPTIKQLIAAQKDKTIDAKVRNAFRLITHYFEYVLPRYLTAFQSLFNFVYKERFGEAEGINLLYVITLLEFGFENKHEIALKEVGMPINIISKIASKFDDCKDLEQIRLKFSLNPYLIDILSEFEKKIFKKYI